MDVTSDHEVLTSPVPYPLMQVTPLLTLAHFKSIEMDIVSLYEVITQDGNGNLLVRDAGVRIGDVTYLHTMTCPIRCGPIYIPGNQFSCVAAYDLRTGRDVL